jgi:acyclic terpene utilization AtuA family protein
VRVGNFSGYLGDRYEAIAEVLGGGPVDVIMGDHLAEVTLASLAAAQRGDPERPGYVAYFLRQLEPHLATVAERGVKVVTPSWWSPRSARPRPTRSRRTRRRCRSGSSRPGGTRSSCAGCRRPRSACTRRGFPGSQDGSVEPSGRWPEVVRHEFPVLRAVHFVLKGLLGTGGSANLRVDQLGKSVGEFLLAKCVPAP